MEFAIDSCVLGQHVSKEFWTLDVGEELACQRDKGNPNDLYVVAVKTDAGTVVGHLPRKIGSLFSVSASEWYDRLKLAHGPVEFPAHSISHFAMNIIMAKTFLSRQSKFRHNFSYPPKFPAIRYMGFGMGLVCDIHGTFCRNVIFVSDKESSRLYMPGHCLSLYLFNLGETFFSTGLQM